MFPTVDSRMEAHVRARRIGGLSGYRITKPAPIGRVPRTVWQLCGSGHFRILPEWPVRAYSQASFNCISA